MKLHFIIPAFLLLILLNCSKDNPGLNEVFMQSMSFTPSSLTVPVGTTVTWTNKESATHTVTSNTAGLFDSGNMGNGATFSHQFNTAGTFPYHCIYHSGMTGTIIVQ